MFESDEIKNRLKSPLSYMMAVDFQTYMLDDILQKVDRATMTHSLEGREPMLDHRILEFAAQLPDHFKYFKGIKKRILRDITHEYVPKKLLDRPKMGFAIPIASWLEKISKNMWIIILIKKNFKSRDFQMGFYFEIKVWVLWWKKRI